MALPAPLYPAWPGTHEQTITIQTGDVVRTIVLSVPRGRCRCDQHAVSIDGAPVPGPQTATSIGRLVAGMVARRPSMALPSE
jgi:hypothetical protein